ncbi:MAG: hypothetical protein R3A48_01070 [Polyangiales bacterium]
MEPTYRVQLYWRGRAAPVHRLADELWRFVQGLGALSPRLAGLRPYTRDDELLPALTGARHAEAVLTHWEMPWRTGDVTRRSYKLGLVLDRIDDPQLRVELVTGLEPLEDLEGLWVPNRLAVLARAGSEFARAEALLGVLQAGVQAFAPDWGFIGLDGDPVPPRPLFSRGEPVAAWVTYLARSYPRLALSAPAASYALGELGSLVMAHAERSEPGSAMQREAVLAVQAAMRAAGVSP